MAFPTAVNSQVTDSVTQSKDEVSAEGVTEPTESSQAEEPSETGREHDDKE